MQEFDEAKKVYMEAKAHHADLLDDLKNKIAGLSKLPKMRPIEADGIAREANSPTLPKPPLDIDRLTWATAWLQPFAKYRMAVRKLYAEIEASDEILTAARRKYARSIRADIESQPQLEAARNALLDIYWARVTAGIQVEFHALLQEYFKTPPQSKLFEARQEFKARYGLD